MSKNVRPNQRRYNSHVDDNDYYNVTENFRLWTKNQKCPKHQKRMNKISFRNLESMKSKIVSPPLKGSPDFLATPLLRVVV